MIRDPLFLPATADDPDDIEALRVTADVMSHIRFLLANVGPPMSARERAVLDLVDIVQDLPMAARQHRSVLLGRCRGYSVSACCNHARMALASAGHARLTDMAEGVRPAFPFGRVLLAAVTILFAAILLVLTNDPGGSAQDDRDRAALERREMMQLAPETMRKDAR